MQYNSWAHSWIALLLTATDVSTTCAVVILRPMFTLDALRALYSRKKKTFRVVENRCLQFVESIFVNLPKFAKSGLKESLYKQVLLVFFFTSFWIFWSGIKPFCFCECLFSLQHFRWRRHRNVRLEVRVDGGRRSTFVSVSPFFKSLERWERSSWL